MDPVSFAASIAAFIQLASQVISVCQYCVGSIKDAPKDIQVILGEVTSLKAILESLPNPSDAQKLAVDSCQKSLTDLAALLPSKVPTKIVGMRKRITMEALAWPLKQTKARKLLADISQHKSTLLLALAGDVARNVEEIKLGVQGIQEALTDSGRHEILQWLERTNPTSKHNDEFRKHEPHTNGWVPRSPQWVGWVDKSAASRLLWVHGIPGAGKTVLASVLIKELESRCKDKDDQACAYYYCLFSRNQSEAAPFLRWIICQLCRRRQWIPSLLRALYDGSCEPSIPELESILEAVVQTFDTVYVVIDAVDETKERQDLLAVIGTLTLDKRFEKIRILATSREYADIERIFAGMSVSLSMSNPLVEEDIRRFVGAAIRSNHRLLRWTDLISDMEDSLARGAKGMFRWAVCQIHILERKRTEREVQGALKNLPKDLDETYIRIFEEIPQEDREFVKRALVMICGHNEIMGSRAINSNVVVVEVLDDLYGSSEYHMAGRHDTDFLREVCGCLITLTHVDDSDSSEEDEPHEPPKHPRAALAHYTVAEFLFSDRISQSSVAFFTMTKHYVANAFGVKTLRRAIGATFPSPLPRTSKWEQIPEVYLTACAHDTLERLQSLRDDNNQISEEAKSLAVQFLNPSYPHYRNLKTIRDERDMYKGAYAVYRGISLMPWWRDLPATIEAAIFFNLFMVGTEADVASGFLNTGNLRELLNARIGIVEVPFYNCFAMDESHIPDPAETVLEVLAQATMRRDETALDFAWLVKNYSLEPESSTTALGYFLPALLFSWSGTNVPTVIGCLLEAGANVEAPEFSMTPLQLAVACNSITAVRKLLDAGANPDGLGTPGGKLCHGFPKLCINLSPLSIAMSEYYAFHDPAALQSHHKAERADIEQLLRGHGARDFVRQVVESTAQLDLS